jgi:two-component system, cell cycle response regulator
MPARALIVRFGGADGQAIARVLERDYCAIEFHDGTGGRAAALEAVSAQKHEIVVVVAADPAAAIDFVDQIRDHARSILRPAVIVAASGGPEAEAECYAAGADLALFGPVAERLLRAQLRAHLRQQRLYDELRLRRDAGQSLGAGGDEADPEIRVERVRVTVVTDREGEDSALRGAFDRAGFSHRRVFENRLAAAARIGDADIVVLDAANESAGRLAAALRAGEAGRHLPILALVDDEDGDLAERLYDLGLADALARPAAPSVLVARVRRLVERHAGLEALRDAYARGLNLAVTDSLTGLFNRRYLETYFELQQRRVGPADAAFSVLAVDIDRFKDINDRFGHAAGDDVLRQVSNRMLASVRGSDTVARLGGEEFVVVMPGADGATAAAVAERLRAVVAERPFAVAGAVTGGAPAILNVTISIGVGEGRQSDAPERLMAAADGALYAAKRGGRNRVVRAMGDGPPPAHAA